MVIYYGRKRGHLNANINHTIYISIIFDRLHDKYCKVCKCIIEITIPSLCHFYKLRKRMRLPLDTSGYAD